jgi:hypothetical protein
MSSADVKDWVEIVLKSKGKSYTILCDKEDAYLFETYTFWVYEYMGGYITIYCQIKGKKLRLNRMIMSPEPGLVVDHINRNPLDNRKSNLRICTSQQNSWNQNKHARGANNFRGVCKIKNKHSVKYRANIYHKGKNITIGIFNTEEEAALAYDKKVREFRGEFGVTNFNSERVE